MVVLRARDSWIEKLVVEKLAGDVRLRGQRIEVAVADGFVTIRGTVTDWHLRLAAQEAAQRAAGVVEVANEVHVELDLVC